MIITRTPFRISLFGGGTDYPVWYKEHGGSVISSTIDKYCYITCRKLPPFFDHKYRIMYSKVENTRTIEDIRHPVVREVLNWVKRYGDLDYGLEIHHDADLPARSGIGSSSAFTVGLLNALSAMQGRTESGMELATQAIHVERELVRDNVGDQDQIAVALGGFNRIYFRKQEHKQTITRMMIGACKVQELQSLLMLFYTRIERMSSKVQDGLRFNTHELTRLGDLTDEAETCLYNGDFKEVGDLLYESWQIKKENNTRASSPLLDEIYEAARSAGAWGGKVIGAGAGGFMLFMVPLEFQTKVKDRLSKLLHVPFKFETSGTKVIFNNE